MPPNRLIWTNDNLVALQTLIDEKDPVTRDWRYRGKVDLVYIDPPFMVNNDFRADNASTSTSTRRRASRRRRSRRSSRSWPTRTPGGRGSTAS